MVAVGRVVGEGERGMEEEWGAMEVREAVKVEGQVGMEEAAYKGNKPRVHM
jgi:hypothetical protein